MTLPMRRLPFATSLVLLLLASTLLVACGSSDDASGNHSDSGESGCSADEACGTAEDSDPLDCASRRGAYAHDGECRDCLGLVEMHFAAFRDALPGDVGECEESSDCVLTGYGFSVCTDGSGPVADCGWVAHHRDALDDVVETDLLVAESTCRSPGANWENCSYWRSIKWECSVDYPVAICDDGRCRVREGAFTD